LTRAHITHACNAANQSFLGVDARQPRARLPLPETCWQRTLLPWRTARAAAVRTSSVMWFRVPSSSSSPYRPQFDSVLKYPSTSSCVGIGRPAVIPASTPPVTRFGAPQVRYPALFFDLPRPAELARHYISGPAVSRSGGRVRPRHRPDHLPRRHSVTAELVIDAYHGVPDREVVGQPGLASDAAALGQDSPVQVFQLST
jgi:hypothetical protein